MTLDSKLKALVIGGSGFIGSYCVDYFKAIGTGLSGRDGSLVLDILEEKDVKGLIEHLRPNLIINCAGMASPDKCEKEKDLAMKLNAETVGYMVDAARSVNATFVQLSTSHIFDGLGGNYRELDKTNPINFYGASKVAGELNAIKYKKTIVLRVDNVVGRNNAKNKTTFFETMYADLSEGKRVQAATDQYFTPSFVEDIAPAIENLVENGESGIFHLASKDRLSRYDFAVRLAEALGVDSSNVKPIEMSSLNMVAKRPKDSSLNVEKISRYVKIYTVSDYLRRLKN